MVSVQFTGAGATLESNRYNADYTIAIGGMVLTGGINAITIPENMSEFIIIMAAVNDGDVEVDGIAGPSVTLGDAFMALEITIASED